ncbi:hypothetical protein LGM85_30215 [Burkholderia multivorans]|uniref:hypothetical protein n=1 Tax=Burkholderia cepacia complex TaxID=87882 RepID=UPI00158C82AE|nr:MULTISPECIES: hypothetical protein [Burkholderia cepacia complex]MCA8488200.1 hypothetical protein [Burkholderia multivorans]MCL4663304.1 hypothetical protein [Burkholderia multivorans]MCO1414984.1 hypothetical protein [Burkholderia multivorans]MCO1448927.1 hypothetical protein [Burkholderia multivorans]MCO8315273.1 hypothetical protein [Burkholderia multivorans]
MEWLRAVFWKIMRWLYMENSREFEVQIEHLNGVLALSEKDLLDVEETTFLAERYVLGMSAFDLAALLWEFRFGKFYREVLMLCADGDIEEIKSLCKQFYRSGKSAREVVQEIKNRTLVKRRAVSKDVQKMSSDVEP